MDVISKEQKPGLYIIEKTFKEDPFLEKGKYCYVEFDQPRIYFYLCDSKGKEIKRYYKNFKMFLPVCVVWQYSETKEAKKELQDYFNNLKLISED